MHMRTLLGTLTMALATLSAAPILASTYEVDFTGTGGGGATVTTDMILNVVQGNVVSGTGTISNSIWGTSTLTFLQSPSLSTTHRFDGGTDYYGVDNAFPIDNNGIVFNVGTLAAGFVNNGSSLYSGGGGLALWSNGNGSYSELLTDTVNGAYQYANQYNGSATVSAVPIPGALTLFGSALLGIGAVARRRRAKPAA